MKEVMFRRTYGYFWLRYLSVGVQPFNLSISEFCRYDAQNRGSQSPGVSLTVIMMYTELSWHAHPVRFTVFPLAETRCLGSVRSSWGLKQGLFYTEACEFHQ